MFRTPQACLEAGEDYPQYDLTVGFDVGKRFHVAFARGAGGTKVLAMRVENLEACVTPSSRGPSRRPAARPPGAWSWSTSAATSARWW